MPQSPIATAADYADAMIVARRAKNWLFGLLLIILLAQLAIFFAARYAPGLTSNGNATAAGRAFSYLQYVVAIIDFLGVALAIVLSLLLFILLAIMLIGRLIGVARVTTALIWSLILIVLLFPWQSFLINPSLAPPVRAEQTVAVVNHEAVPATMPATNQSILNPLAIPAGPAINMATGASAAPTTAPIVVGTNPPRADFMVPGVLYTWTELTHPTVGARFGLNAGYSLGIKTKALRWARYVAFPIIALLILLTIQAKSRRGLRLALGEADYDSSAPVAG